MKLIIIMIGWKYLEELEQFFILKNIDKDYICINGTVISIDDRVKIKHNDNNELYLDLKEDIFDFFGWESLGI